MKNIIFYPVVALMLLVFTTGCKEQNPTAYKNDPAIYFSYGGAEVGQADTVEYSFSYSTSDEYVLNLQVTTQGELSDVPRPISIRQYNTEPEGEDIYDNNGTPNDPSDDVLLYPKSQPAQTYDSINGTGHYLPFTDPRVAPSMFVPANSAKATIPIIIKKVDPDLIDTRFILRLELLPTDDYRLGMHEHTKFCFVFTGRMEKPSRWGSWNSYFGASWGPVKMQFLIETIGDFNWESPPSDPSYMRYLGDLVKMRYRQMYTENPDPDAPKALYERDGTIVSYTS